MTIIGWLLLARARRTASALLILIALGIAEWLLGTSSLRLRHDNSLSVPWAVLVPMLAASVIGVTTRSAVGQLELGTARALPALRAGHLAAMLAVAVVSTSLGSSGLSGPIGQSAALRNLLGFTGLALLSAALLGGNLAWPLPVAFGLVALTVGASQGQPRSWAWPIQYNDNLTAQLVAAVVLVLGSATLVIRGTRESAAEAS